MSVAGPVEDQSAIRRNLHGSYCPGYGIEREGIKSPVQLAAYPIKNFIAKVAGSVGVHRKREVRVGQHSGGANYGVGASIRIILPRWVIGRLLMTYHNSATRVLLTPTRERLRCRSRFIQTLVLYRMHPAAPELRASSSMRQHPIQ